MTEIKITIAAPEIADAINNLAGAINALAKTTPNGTTACAVPTNTTCVAAEQPAPNPTTPATVPQTATVAPNTPPVNYPIEANQSVAQPAQVVTTPPAQQPTTPAVPTSAPQYTLEMLSVAGTALFDAGKGKELTGLLAKYGVDALTSLDPAYYGAFATELRAMGASI